MNVILSRDPLALLLPDLLTLCSKGDVVLRKACLHQASLRLMLGNSHCRRSCWPIGCRSRSPLCLSPDKHQCLSLP